MPKENSSGPTDATDATEWVFHYGAGFHVSSVQQGLQISSYSECKLNGFFVIVKIFVYLQFSKVCEFRVTLSATEWVFHYCADFYLSSVKQALCN